MMILPILWSWLTADIDVVLNDPALKGASVAVCVSDLDGNVLYERNADQLMTPASNQKLLSNLFALQTLGPDYVALTRIWKLKDKIVVDCPGDPSMTRELLLRAKMALSIGSTTDVEVHEGYRPGIPPSWEFDDLPNKYAAPITAFTVDKGSFELWAENGKLTPLHKAFGVRVKSVDGLGKPVVSYDPFKALITVTGTIPKAKTRLDTLALSHPDESAAWFLGGPLKLTDEVPTTPPDVVLTSRSIGNIVAECLTTSDNNFAEHLLLMSAQKLGTLGDEPYVVAEKRLSSFLSNTVGLPAGSFHVEDGSGVSRHDMVSVRGISQLLLWANRQPFAGTFKAALAAPGKGTLKARLSGIDFKGKTGSLDLVSSISGYLKTASGKELVVSIIFNQCAAGDGAMHQLQDKIIADLSANGTVHAWASSHAQGSSFKSAWSASVDRLR